MKTYSSEWEKIGESSTYRMMVPGGWLVSTSSFVGESTSEAMCFFPDPGYDWVIE